MKAQMVKNAVIVPVGRQGRLRRQAPAARRPRGAAATRSSAATARSSAACSTSPTTSSTARSCRRRDVVRYDGDDPYLVVAADKGTATLLRRRQRDRAPSTASGSATRSPRAARPATTTRRWASPRAAPGSRSSATSASSGIDVQTAGLHRRRASATCRATCSATACCSRSTSGWSAPSTTATSSSTPTPDPSASCEERKRLFELPALVVGRLRRGADLRGRRRLPAQRQVDPALAAGARGARRRGRGADAERADPRAPARARRPALERRHRHLREGRATRRTPTSATRPTTRVRVDAAELRCRVVGEGGNLGLTQRARIEYALGGGRINTDAIDNSAGVDCSDHEVNIKILLDAVVAERRPDREAAQRAARGDDRRGRRAACCKDNYEQTETLSLAEAQARGMLDVHARLHPRPRAVAQARPRARGAARPTTSWPSARRRTAG